MNSPDIPITPRASLGKTPSPATHKGVITESRYLLMSDGCRIAADIMRPKSARDDERLATVVIIARYWRAFALRGIAPPNRAPIGPRDALPDFLLARGYAVVVVDSRGSGASFGSTQTPFNERELRDHGEVVDWVIAQPWSNGLVGATGISYEGIAAEFLAVAHPTATRVVIPQEADIDQYAQWLFPGGIPNALFIDWWQQTNNALDQGRIPGDWGGLLARVTLKGVRPVDEDKERTLLKQAIAEHAENGDLSSHARGVIFRDDPLGSTGVTLDDLSVISYRDKIEASGAAISSWGSWMDGSTADGVLQRFATYSNPQRAVIGAWSHRFLNHATPFVGKRTKVRPPLKEQWQEIVEYLNYYLRDSETPQHAEKKLYYYTMGEEAWKVTATWPPAGSTTDRWFLGNGRELTRQAPDANIGYDVYAVDFNASTGKTNRWWSQDGVSKEHYGDRAKADERLLTYTSPPLTEDLEVTGHPVVTLFVTSTETDGAFHVYLEAVDGAGRVTYLTEGHLRAIHRHVSNYESPFRVFVPHHSFLRADAAPLVPGEVAELRFGLLPVSALVRKGHRLRVAIAGHDKDTFARIPEEGFPTITVERNRVHASHMDLPVVHR